MGLKRYLTNLFRHDRNTRRLLHELNTNMQQAIRGEDIAQRVYEKTRIQYLEDKVLNSNELGVTGEKLCENEVVVSLTTYGVRIHKVYLAIESIMQGSVKPNRIVLWLSEEEFKEKPLPVSLQKQIKRGLQIEYCSDIKSFKKLIPSLKMFPNACVVTIDDDIIYDFDLLEKLLLTHKSTPNSVCANRIHRMKLDENNMPISYINWDWCVNEYEHNKLHFLTGGGGVLYPPHVFTDKVFNEEVFMDICKYADDVWFNAMLLLNNIPIIKSYTNSSCGQDYVDISEVQYVGLCHENTNAENCRNDIQINAVWKKYKINKLFE